MLGYDHDLDESVIPCGTTSAIDGRESTDDPSRQGPANASSRVKARCNGRREVRDLGHVDAPFPSRSMEARLSGRPFTAYDQGVSTAQRRGVYDLTRVNASRAPDCGRVDIRVDRTFTAGGRPLNLFAGVQNVTNRRNFASYSWNRRTNSQQFGEQQGTFPIIGLDWRF